MTIFKFVINDWKKTNEMKKSWAQSTSIYKCRILIGWALAMHAGWIWVGSTSFHRNFRWAKFAKMNEWNSFISLKFSRISMYFRSIKIEIFPFRIKNIVFLRKNKILNKGSKNSTKMFAKMNENIRFRSHFRWLNEIFAKEIERKFGNPKYDTVVILCVSYWTGPW